MNRSIEIIIPAEMRSAFVPTPSITIEDLGSYYEFSEDSRPHVVICIRCAEAVALGLLTNFLYDAVKDRATKEAAPPKKICIEREWIELDRGSITRRVTEVISIER